jgi:hypothetical protein
MTDQPKWTKGPWPIKPTGDFKRIVIGDGLVDGPGGYEVAEVYSDDCDRDEAMANAHLIAAAPDLYAALEAIRDNEVVRAICPSPLWGKMADAMIKARGETK